MDDTTATSGDLPKLYTTNDVAEMFAVTPETVRNWIIKGKLKAVQTPSQQYRVTRPNLLDFAKSHYGVEA